MKDVLKIINNAKKEITSFDEKDTYKRTIYWLEESEMEVIKKAITVTHSSMELKCDCGETEDVKKIAICASCYNPHTGEW